MNNVFEYYEDGKIIPFHKSIRTYEDSKSEYLRERVNIGGKLKKRSELTPEEKKALSHYEKEKEKRERLKKS